MIKQKTIILIASSFSMSKVLSNAVAVTATYIAKVLKPIISDLHPLILLLAAIVASSKCYFLMAIKPIDITCCWWLLI